MRVADTVKKALSSFRSELVDILLNDAQFMREAEKIILSEKEDKAIRKIRERGYYYLRRYRIGDIDVSSIERGEIGSREITDFLSELITRLNCDSVIDIGCGTFPTSLIYWKRRPSVYYAIDKNPEVIKELSSLSAQLPEVNLIPVRLDISDIESLRAFVRELRSYPCIALYSRILHSIFRAHRIDPITVISSVPSRVAVILEPRTSLVKMDDITRKEKTFLRKIASRSVRLGLCYRCELVEFSNDIGLLLYLS